jgi:photosystem II stability/assembly factor-like uncharacterized protein
MFGVRGTAGGRARPTARRGVVVALAACVGVLVAACGSAARAPGAGPASAPAGGRAGSGAATATRPAANAPAVTSPGWVGVMDLAAPGLGLVALGTGAQAGGSARLASSADYGRSFRTIGPVTAAWTSPDSVFFLGRQDGWFAVFNVSTTAETMYRTTDGGHTWRAFGAPGHVLAAGSQDTVQFITPSYGWLLDVQPTGPLESLYVTTDGGASWRAVASSHPEPGQGVLPELGQVRFGPGLAGWLGGGMFSRSLYRTGNGGRTWQPAEIPAPPGSVFGLPAVFGRTLIEPVTDGRALTLYRSTDGGTHWRKLSALPDATGGGCAAGQVSVSFPTPRSGWAAAVLAARTVVYRTTDGGLSWTRTGTSWPVPPDSCEPPAIQATDAAHAWLLTAGSMRIYATTSGGTAWRRIDSAAMAAAG